MSDDKKLKVHIHYGGVLLKEGNKTCYSGGSIAPDMLVDPDLLTFSLFEDFNKNGEGVSDVEKLWYRLPNQELSEARSIWQDKDKEIMQMASEAKDCGEVYVYVGHSVSTVAGVTAVGENRGTHISVEDGDDGHKADDEYGSDDDFRDCEEKSEASDDEERDSESEQEERAEESDEEDRAGDHQEVIIQEETRNDEGGVQSEDEIQILGEGGDTDPQFASLFATAEATPTPKVHGDTTQPSQVDEGSDIEDEPTYPPGVDIDELIYNTEHLTLCQFISHGDLQGVKEYLHQRPESITALIDHFETPLIKACSYGHLEIVKELLQRLSPEEMLTHRFSPLGIEATYGHLEIVVVLLEKNPDLAVHADPTNGDLPVVSASQGGFIETTRYLYERTPLHVLMDDDRYSATSLLLNAMSLGMFDIAWDILGHAPSLAVTRQPRLGSSLLVTLASKPDLFPSVRHLGFWRRLVYSSIIDLELPTDGQTTSSTPCQRIMWMFLQCLPKWFGIQGIYDLKERRYKAHDFLHRVCRQVSAMEKDTEWKTTVQASVFTAVNFDNSKFIMEIIKCIPGLLWVKESSSHQNIFQLAVASRKANTFSLIYGLDVSRRMILRGHDKEGNNILHLAAHLSPPTVLSKVAGAVLMIQLELQWFMAVKTLMPEQFITRKNNAGITPQELFVKSHEALRKEGEVWMKYIASAASVIAALIATITFQAAFTTPGGNDNLGDPIHLHDLRYILFILFDTTSFFTSCTSVVIFLSILTSRYSFKDFYVSLPKKLLLSLAILFIAMVTMLVAFSSALLMLLRRESVIAIEVIPLAFLPAFIFVGMQYPLVKEMVSMFRFGFSRRKTKLWL